MGSIFSFIITIFASLIGGYFINEMFQKISFFGKISQESFFESFQMTEKHKSEKSAASPSSVGIVTKQQIKD